MPPLIARPRDPPPPLSDNGEKALRRRSLAASAALHAGILIALLMLLRSTPLPEEHVVPVTVLQDLPGSEGAAAGGGGGGGDAARAQSAPEASDDNTRPTPEEAREATAEPAEMADVPPQPPQEPRPAPAASATAPVLATELPPPPRHKPSMPHHHRAEPTHLAHREPTEAEPPLRHDEPVEIAAAPAARPTPGTPGSGTGPGGSGSAGTGTDGAGPGAAGSGSGPGDDYLDRVRRHMRKFQRYPAEAVQKKEEGTVLLDITLARNGSVLDVSVAKSSGFPLLDEAAVKMARDASPVPPFPPNYAQNEGTATIPANYRLGTFDRLF